MIFRNIYKKTNLKDFVDEVELVLLMQYGIDIRENYFQKSNSKVSEIIKYCDEKLNPLVHSCRFFTDNHFSKNEIIKRSSILSVYNTVCSLLDDDTTMPFETIRKDFKINNETKNLHIALNDSGKNSNISKIFFNNSESYLYNCIAPKNKKQLYKFGAHTSMLLMWKYKDFNIIDIPKERNTPLTSASLKNIINSYLKTSEIIAKAIGEKGINVDYKRNRLQYINDLAVLETVSNAKLFSSILSILCYLIYNNHNLTDFLIDTLIQSVTIPGIFYRDYWLYLMTHFIKNKNEFTYNGFDYLDRLKDGDSLGKKLHNEFDAYDRKYIKWQEDARTFLCIVSKIILPIYENTLFFLIYKNFYNEKYTLDAVLSKMKNGIEEFLKTTDDPIWVYDYGFYNVKDQIITFVSPKHESREGSYLDSVYKNSKKLIWEDIYNKIDWRINKSNFVLFEKFVFGFFKFIKDYQERNNNSHIYTITYDSFNIGKLLNDHKEGDFSKESNEFTYYRNQLLYTVMKYNISINEKNTYL